jgi:toxin-antitoxin system PIN domain toxin
MIAIDTNILVYAHREDSPFHLEAARCMVHVAEGVAPWALPWPCVHEFFSIVTHPKIYDPTTPGEIAIDQIEAWLESPSVSLLSESGTYWGHLKRIAETAQTTGPMIHDARIAALCIENGVTTLLTADRDFGRFPMLETRNPLMD